MSGFAIIGTDERGFVTGSVRAGSARDALLAIANTVDEQQAAQLLTRLGRFDTVAQDMAARPAAPFRDVS